MQTMRKDMTPQQAKEKWKVHEAAEKELESAGSHWQDRIEVPCRRCSGRKGVEVAKPLRAFIVPSEEKPQEVWKTCMSLGQDLNCFQCRRELWRLTQRGGVTDPGKHAIYCSTCETPRGFEFFSAADQEAWRSGEEAELELQCRPCSQGKTVTSAEEAPKHLCLSCNEVLPFYHFVSQQLNAWKHKGTVEVKAECARCYTRRRTDLGEHEQIKCKACQVTKHIREFDCVSIRSWMDGKHLEGTHWVCYECHYPPCGICAERPMHAVVHNSWVSKKEYEGQANAPILAVMERFNKVQKQWFCTKCKYPPCSSQAHPDLAPAACWKTRNMKRHNRFKIWVCQGCQGDRRREDDAWRERLEEVIRLVSEVGHIPKRNQDAQTVEYQSAAKWVDNQMTKGRQALPKEQVEELEKVPGWVWTTRASAEDEWHERLADVTRIAQQAGHVPRQKQKGQSAEYEKAAAWVKKQKEAKQKGTLSRTQVKALEKVPHWAEAMSKQAGKAKQAPKTKK